MAHYSSESMGFVPDDPWHIGVSILPDFTLWDSSEPGESREAAVHLPDGTVSRELPVTNSFWAAETSLVGSAEPQSVEPHAYISDSDLLSRTTSVDEQCFVDPQDTILDPGHSTTGPPLVLQQITSTEEGATVVGFQPRKSRRFGHVRPHHHDTELVATVEPKTKKPRRARLPCEATSRFRTWFREHRTYPYPTANEVLALAHETQTTTKQVKSWFSNIRTRLQHDSSSSINGRIDSFEHQGLTTSALETWSRTSGSPRSLDSVKRYLDLPEAEVASSSQMLFPALNTVSTTGWEVASSHAEELPSWLADTASHQYSTAPSVSGSDHHSVFSGMSLASLGSALSGRTSFTSASASGGSRRRGKRRFDHLDSDASLVCKKFPCTFCAKTFAATYDWKRHEATHLPFVAQWICMPDGIAIDEDGECMFCFAPDVDEAHLRLHIVDSCQQKPIEQRTFGRKDQLKQHIEICHLTKAQKADSHMLNKFLDHWQRPVELSWRNDEHKEALWCGFCCTHSHSWKERQDHVAEHLRNGYAMSNWHSYRKFITYCRDKWDEKHAASFGEYSQYVDHLITTLRNEGTDNPV